MERINLKNLLILILVFALMLAAGCSGLSTGPGPASPGGQASGEQGGAEPAAEKPSAPAGEQSGAGTRAVADPNEGLLVVHFLDVGQGDACLVELPDGRTMLIDGGSRDAFDTVKNYLDDREVDKIDFLIATHPHEDHIGGLIGVIAEYEIGKIYMPRATHNTKTYEQLLETIKQKGLKITTARSGVQIEAGEGVEALFVAPVNDNYEDLNNYSAVLKLTYGQVSFLFTGDAEKEAERDMLKKGVDLKAQVLKVGHHGSSTSTSPDFLAAVNPEVAVISCGADNSYGHPHEEVLERLYDKGIDMYRTDLVGNVVVTCDDQKIIRVLSAADYLSGG